MPKYIVKLEKIVTYRGELEVEARDEERACERAQHKAEEGEKIEWEEDTTDFDTPDCDLVEEEDEEEDDAA